MTLEDYSLADDVDGFEGFPEWHDVYTVTLGELVEMGIFDWDRPELNWKAAAYNEAQYDRVCSYFIRRFYWREISLLPIKQWFWMLQSKLIYELMPKYKPLYERVQQGFDPIADQDEYKKMRHIGSEYPETLLSGNSDYITTGTDEEYERIVEGNTVNSFESFALRFKSVDQWLLDELEEFFTCMYTANVNGF